MEENTVMNSCLMWAIGLYTPVDLASIFKSEDLRDTGLELDSHLTLLYAQGKILPRKDMMSDIETILSDEYEGLLDICKTENRFKVLDVFDLGSFENDSDYIVLKLKKDCEQYRILSLINKGLKTKYGVSSEFSEYTPHLTLAQLQLGKAKDYLANENLKLILENSYFDFEDIMISFGTSSEPVDRKQYFLTQYKNIDRYFRLKHLKEYDKELD